MDPTMSQVVKRVMAHYPVEIKQIYLLSFKGKKAVWSVDTDQGELIVKKVPFAPKDIGFMIHAIDYLRERGVHTPAVWKTTNDQGFVTVDGEHFVVFEAVRGRSPEYKIEGELRLIMRGMAAFHQASRGIESPTGEFPSMLLNEWEKDMTVRLGRLETWKAEVTHRGPQGEFDRLFLDHVDVFLSDGRKAIALLAASGFERWLEQTRAAKTLCHQDFAAGNLAIGDDGLLYVYDMDSLTVDVPIRDLRKILNKVMKKDCAWSLERMLFMLRSYQEVHALTDNHYRSLTADLLFPHLFYGQVSKYYERREPNWTERKHIERLNEMIATEHSKRDVLEAFLNRLGEVVGHG
ncbi:CotS family spore coat protein [Paenibacillus sp.]|uniref:CotS family spore coat protein n=1 Tax=Paenibacillus sp. TaxID=58172 RepID=UPI002D2683E9|nr:CotS family spore coat protein [Paenibacillus sp.]HZG84333.1 CotS family spore coat protein [Paenibacillus sp.]